MKINRQEHAEGPESKQCRYCKMPIPKEASVCPYCRKKQKGKARWIVAGVLFAVILLVVAGGGSDRPDAQQTNAQTELSAAGSEPGTSAVTEPAVEAIPSPEPSPEPDVTRYESGMYLVGTDIPAGEYVLFAERSQGYMEVASDSSGNFECILCNDNFSYNTIVTLEEGYYFSMNRACAVPMEEASVDTSGNGMFKVGVHIPAGEYKVVVDEGTSAGSGYFEVATDSRHDFTSIRTNDNIESSAYISVSEGEYLTLNRCHLER